MRHFAREYALRQGHPATEHWPSSARRRALTRATGAGRQTGHRAAPAGWSWSDGLRRIFTRS
jgi:hypothetical protein